MAGAADDVARAGEWLRDLETQYQPDLVHLNGYAHATLPWSVPVVVVAHSCVQTWWRAVHGAPAPSEFRGYSRDLRRGLRAATRVVAPTAAFLAQLRRAHGELPHAEVIFNGRDAAGLAPGRKEPFFLSIGRLWDEAKNVRALARIAPMLPWPVRLAGDPTSPDGLHVPLANVDLLGRQTPEEVASWMARAAVYVSPARYEPFGLSILEAALSGCALVLSDIATLREIWEDAAIYVDSDDGAALARRLRELARGSERRLRLGRAASERARRFTVSAMTRRYLELYQVLHDEATGATATRAVSA
ncbi:MAG TPA: glycosyltransferase family 4 protein, partial [Candidatus Synoicihabitans sp.]|nr:glycosyltransferase family 4 protein [Candidatus Synoicihabitans sp.]